MKYSRGALFLLLGLSIYAALHAETLAAPTLVYQEYREHFIGRQGGALSRAGVGRAIKEVRTYLADQMRDTTEYRIEVLSRHIVYLARAYNIPAGLILSIIKVESNFQPWAVSPRGALGLMQLMPETAEWMASRYDIRWNGPATLLDEEINTEIGVRYLAYLSRKYGGDLQKMLTAYNRGPAKVDEDVNEGRSIASDYYLKIKSFVPKMVMADAQVMRVHAN